MPDTQHLFFSAGESAINHAFVSIQTLGHGLETFCVRVSAPWVSRFVLLDGMRRGGTDCCASVGEERKERFKLASIVFLITCGK